MAVVVELTKGKKFNLTKDAPELASIEVGAGWDKNQYAGADFDIDLAAIMVGADGKLTSQDNLVFFGSEKTPEGGFTHASGAVTLSADNRTGEGEGDDETVTINFAKIPEGIEKITIVATVYDAIKLGQKFGMIEKAVAVVRNAVTKEELATFDMSEDFDEQISLVIGHVYLHNGEWKFNAVGQGYEGKDLNAMIVELAS